MSRRHRPGDVVCCNKNWYTLFYPFVLIVIAIWKAMDSNISRTAYILDLSIQNCGDTNQDIEQNKSAKGVFHQHCR